MSAMRKKMWKKVRGTRSKRREKVRVRMEKGCNFI
jgi:hypothetical protein